MMFADGTILSIVQARRQLASAIGSLVAKLMQKMWRRSAKHVHNCVVFNSSQVVKYFDPPLKSGRG